jgi:putative oxidoreductase
MNSQVVSIAGIAGRIGLSSLFILGAINKLLNYGATQTYMSGVGLEPTAILLPLTIALEGIGGLLVASGVRLGAYAGVALAIFTLATNAYFHRFWELDGTLAQLQLSLFFKNVAIAGGLIFAAAQLASKASK